MMIIIIKIIMISTERTKDETRQGGQGDPIGIVLEFSI